MIWFVISIVLLLFSAAVTGIALSNNVKGAGIGLIPGLVGLLLLIPACLYSVDVGEVAVITKKYTEAQAAEIDKQKALNEQQVAKTEAETKKIKAQGEADANAVLNESLTDNVLKQHYIDALSNADQLVVVPDGADTLVQTK